MLGGENVGSFWSLITLLIWMLPWVIAELEKLGYTKNEVENIYVDNQSNNLFFV